MSNNYRFPISEFLIQLLTKIPKVKANLSYVVFNFFLPDLNLLSPLLLFPFIAICMVAIVSLIILFLLNTLTIYISTIQVYNCSIRDQGFVNKPRGPKEEDSQIYDVQTPQKYGLTSDITTKEVEEALKKMGENKGGRPK